MSRQKKLTFEQKAHTNAHKISNLDELKGLRRSLAKTANQRLVRLKAASSPISGEKYTFGAYDIAMQYIEDAGRNRFSEQYNYIPQGKDSQTDVQKLRDEIDVLQGFLSMKSSRVGGMHEIEKLRIKTFEEKGIHFASNREFYDFLNSETFKKLCIDFDSDKLVEEFQRAAENGMSLSDIKDAMENYRRHSRKKSIKGLRASLERTRKKKERSDEEQSEA